MKIKLQTSFDELYNNCLYSSIAHAISNLKQPLFDYTQSWDWNNYNFHYGYSRGTISFDLPNKILVGAIRDEKSIRISWYPKDKANKLFEEAPESSKHLFENEALQYLFDEVDGVTLPVATTAFWSQENQIVTCDDLDDFMINGGEFIFDIIVPMEELQTYWKEQYELTSEEMELIGYLFQLKKNGKTEINKSHIELVDKNCEGYMEFIESLLEIGFNIEG